MSRNTVHLTVTVTRELGKFVRDRVASGSFATQSEVVRAGLRALRRAEPEDPWAEAGPASGSPSGRQPDPEPSKVKASDPLDDDRARLRKALPMLYRHGRAALRLCEEYGAENLQVPMRELRLWAKEEDRKLLRLVVDADPERIYPVTAELGKRIGELLGVYVWLDELRIYRWPSKKRKYMPLEPLFSDHEPGSDSAGT